MTYIYDNATGRVAAIVLQGTPVPSSGFTLSVDEADPDGIISEKRDIGTGLLVTRDFLTISGVAAVPAGAVGQVAVQKLDGTTNDEKTDAGDDDPVNYVLEHEAAFMNKSESALANGADAVKIAAPSTSEDARFMAFSPELQLLDTKVSFD